MKLIVAVDENWAIGKDDKLLVSIPDDMRFFRETTTGHVVVMGRNTLDSFPGGRPLKNRVNIVLNAGHDDKPEGTITVMDLEELKEVLKAYDSEEVFVIGGGTVYRLLLSWCDTAYITKVHAAYEADTWFPNLDEDPDWHLAEQGEEKEYEGLTYALCTYKK